MYPLFACIVIWSKLAAYEVCERSKQHVDEHDEAADNENDCDAQDGKRRVACAANLDVVAKILCFSRVRFSDVGSIGFV